MDIAGWRIWYRDGTVYSSRSHEWKDLPDDGVISVCVYYDAFTVGGIRYRKMLDGKDWYYLNPDGELDGIPSKEWGDNWEPRPDVPDELIKRGVGVSDLEFDIFTQKMSSSQW